MKSRTTGSATSASSSAIRISRSISCVLASVSRASPRIVLTTRASRWDRFSNMVLRYTRKVTILLVLFGLPALLYAAAWAASWRDGAPLRRPDQPAGATDPAGPAADPPARRTDRWLPAALVLHGASLFWPWGDGFRFGFEKALSATMWIGVALLWLEGQRVLVDALRVLILPPAAGALLLPLAFPGAEFARAATQPLFVPLRVVGTLAYGVLRLSGLRATMMGWVEADLRDVGREPSRLSRLEGALPPLMVLERILFRFIA